MFRMENEDVIKAVEAVKEHGFGEVKVVIQNKAIKVIAETKVTK